MTMNNKFLNTIYDFSSVLLTAILAVSVIFTFGFKISAVIGDSMKETLHNGDNVVISAVTPDLKYGDVVVISQPNGYEKVLIKRVIAVGGQTVSFDRLSGKVLVDGVALDEPYIRANMIFTASMNNTYTVPEGCLFVMGDNRNESADSRDKNVGFIDERYVVGKVIYKFGDKQLFNSDFEESKNA